ncbi:30S ribosomal protein S13 [bacterium (Candidatus Moisslbacteria) CG12_big_fil_rev_8_21_14_0_65_36_11]|nr:30S ribosomal protein S13 [Candidatus Kuenenbacteria bacterium]OIP76609.1 MAG: 30S ribosomal protein S13 [Parcubacteria group bacterium CG2_30_36_38]PIV46121.1 MAG: 30S ribosomal protein S13 [bacterium (Candidatus Moisslbacteria) CG02_land_8_20_14_3_00_36_53]PIW67680.1 MAG: 30S ribosomal protein S13 [bacterium (Candidatus Moisslbacteria) CG12_big_fil_rev_8_21_14_0_65_36_11]PIZ90343.1 MAG: 30S ribosomal protein S13 [bacterium (Candidatus Moisslbacteria) CG_4_10_14_0_2_um_filter_36_61]PJC0067
MARIMGINIPNEKRVEIGLTYIFGIGRSLSDKILEATKINKDKRVKDLTSQEVEKIQNFIGKNYKVEGALKRDIVEDIKRLKNIGCYRGVRHTKHLPARGQRSKTNSRTVRGNVRKTIGGTTRPSLQKT